MPRKLPTEHRHEFPGERGSRRENDAPFECQNEVVIKDILRRLAIVESLSNQIQKVDSRLRVIEDRPAPLIPKVPDNDAVQIPRAFGEFFDKVLLLESNAATKADLENLAVIVADIGNAALMQAGIMVKRADALEARVSGLPNDLMREVLRAQSEVKNRRA